MRARACAQTDVAASSRILVLITAKQRGNRESDTDSEPRERLQGDREDRWGQAGPKGPGPDQMDFSQGWQRGQTQGVCFCGARAKQAPRQKEPQAMARGGAGAVFSSDS